jgi:ABC-2 type transport system permease protein
MSLIGGVLYGVDVPWDHAPAVLVTLAIGSATFCCLGLALTAAIPSENAAAPMANAIVLPLYFISGIFVPEDQLPDAMQTIGAVFPVQPLFDALLIAFDPFTSGVGFAWADLAVVAAWGVGGALVALARFRWVPRR